MKDKIKLLKQLRDNGQLTEEMFRSNIQKLINPGKSDTLANTIKDIEAGGGMRVNTADIKKTTGSDLLGIDPNVRQKDAFPKTQQLWKKNVAPIAEEAAPKAEGWATKILKDTKGFAGVAPMAAMGVGALGVMPIAKKLQEEDWRGAAGDTAELAANVAFPVASTIFNSPEVGAADIPEAEMRDRAIFNAARQKGVSNPSNEEPLMTLLPEEDRAKKEDMDAILNNIRNKYR